MKNKFTEAMAELNADVLYHLLMEVAPEDLNHVGRWLPGAWKVRTSAIFQRAYLAQWIPRLNPQVAIGWAVFRREKEFQQALKFYWNLSGLMTEILQHQDYSTAEWILERYPAQLARNTSGWKDLAMPTRLRILCFKYRVLSETPWIPEAAWLSENPELASDHTSYVIWLLEHRYLDHYLCWHRHLNYQSKKIFPHLLRRDQIWEEINSELKHGISARMCQFESLFGPQEIRRLFTLACRQAQLSIVRYLVQRGFSPQIKHLQIAVNQNHSELLTYLRSVQTWSRMDLQTAADRTSNLQMKALLLTD